MTAAAWSLPPLPHARTPLLLLDLEAFERNVARMVHAIIVQGGKQWRPHVKAIRSPALACRLLQAGATGVTCSTVDEAQAMVDGGVPDVLVASQVVQPQQLERLAALNRRARVAVALDHPRQLELAAAAARQAQVRLPVLVEVEVGLQRAGTSPGAATLALARQVHAESALALRGLMAWEGHTTRIPDPAAKAAAIRHAIGQLSASAALCREAGLPVEVVSCGGTGTFETTSTLAGVTELQAGGGLFGDLRYREDFGVPLEPALRLCATVLARPTSTRIVCDAGFKALAVYPKPPQPVGLEQVASMAHAAEHLTLHLHAPAERPTIGERIAFDIGYADATTFLHKQIACMRAGNVEGFHALPAR
jgi:D-serine deaminase-like pyridoxal phosphate-dependent protein